MATIEAKFTLGTNVSGNSTSILEDFLDGSGNLKDSSTLIYGGFLLYGMNFEALRGKNFTVTGFTLKITGGRYNTSQASKTALTYGFRANGNEIEIGEYSYTILTGSVAPTTAHTINASQQCTELLPWINANKTAFLDNSFSNSFCVYFGLRYAQIKAATVVLEYELEKSKITVVAGTGGTVSGGGEYEDGTTVTLKATPNTGYKFVKWSDGNTSATRTVTVSGNATYTAQFERITVSISASASPSEGGTITGTGTYAYGDSYTLTAVPNEGYRFVRWSSSHTTPSITRTASILDEEFIAYFELAKINKIYVGTQQPKEIYVGTTPIKAIYVGTTKVYG